jgi:hypothetical protein
MEPKNTFLPKKKNPSPSSPAPTVDLPPNYLDHPPNVSISHQVPHRKGQKTQVSPDLNKFTVPHGRLASDHLGSTIKRKDNGSLVSSLTSRRSNRGTESDSTKDAVGGGILRVELTSVGGCGDLMDRNYRQEFELVSVGGDRFQLGSKNDHNMLMES